MKIKYFIGLVIATLILLGISVNVNTIEEIKISSPRPMECFEVDDLYTFYKEKPRPETEDYAVYVFDTNDDDFLLDYSQEFIGTSRIETVNNIASFVQNIPYINEEEEYPKYPIETLQDNSGDCEDKAILCASLLSSLDYSVCLLRLPNHMAVGIKSLGFFDYIEGYSFLEVTQSGHSLGDIPEKYKNEIPKIHSLETRPIFIHDWKSADYCKNMFHKYVKLDITVENQGLIGGNGELILLISNDDFSITKSIAFFIDKKEYIDIEIKETLPENTCYNIKTQIRISDKIVDEKFGDFGDES